MRDPEEPCRLCMGRSHGIEIYPSDESSQLASEIAYSVGIKVKASDSRRTLCRECFDKIKSLYDFKLMCQKTENQFGSAYQSPSKQTVAGVKIKKEPGTDDSTSPIGKAPVAPLPFKPCESWPQGGMVIYATVNQNGQMVPVQAMVPVGEPIPFHLGMPMIPPILPVLPTSGASVPQQVSLVTPKKEPLENEIKTITLKDKSQPAQHETSIPTQTVEKEIVSSSGKPANATASEDSDDDLNEVLEQVHTDVEDEDDEKVSTPESRASSRVNQRKRKRAGPKSSKLKRKEVKGKTINNQESTSSKAVTPGMISVKHQREEEDSDLDSSIKSSKKGTPGSRSTKNSRKEEDSNFGSNNKSKTVSPEAKSTNPLREEEDLDSKSEGARIRRKTRGMHLKESEESKKIAYKPSTPCSRPTRSCVANQRRIVVESEDSDEVAFDVDSDSDSAFSNKNMSSSESDWDDPDNDASNKFHRVRKLSHSSQYDVKKNLEVNNDHNVDKKSEGNDAVDNKSTFKFTKQLQCKFCPRTFRSEQYLKCHEETHRTVKRFTCMKCDQIFSSRSVLERHEETNHVNETWECRPCFVAFAQIKTWRSHVKRHKSYPRETVVSVPEEKVIKVEKIELSPKKDQSDQETPVKTLPKKKSFEKPSSSKNTKKRKFYSTASEEEEDVDNPDSVDNPDFVDVIDSADRTEEVSKKKETCALCNAVFDDDAALLEHMVKTHQKPKGPPFSCKYCDRPFQDKGALICHETEHRPSPDPKNIKCRFCEIEFSSLSDKICHEEISHRK